MLLINVLGEALHRGVSTTKAKTVGKVDANDSHIMVPEALHVKASICPGVSIYQARKEKGVLIFKAVILDVMR